MQIKKRSIKSTFREQKSKLEESTSLESLFHLILLDDNEHSYHYVIEMLGYIFDYSEEKAWTLARIVDTQGQVIIETASRSICEEHQLQVHNYGADHRITSSKGSMSAIIESST
ncbi:MAG: ATP-dependent Clp protease adaptor ClpS [Dehalococcoidia bacterium]|nr:ATP-dependent Clp protease adaptor ClpS [Dehalococcoidia bacterium]